MNEWHIVYMPEALKDLEELDGSQRIQVRKAIKKVRKNPLPVTEGGYGKPLGNKNGNDLSGLLKIKLLKLGIRVVYRLVKVDGKMVIVVIGARSDNEVYDIASKRHNQ